MSESHITSPAEHARQHEGLQTAEARQQLLDEFAEDPNNDILWEKAYEWVAAEDGVNLEPAIADDIPGQELVELAKKIRQTPQEDRYGLMTERASTGERWFDVLKTFGSEQLGDVEGETVKSWAERIEPEGKFYHALDLGTGTGKSLAVVEPYAEAVVGYDRNQDLLEVAKEVAGENTALIRGEVDELPFDDASFDLITSSGLTGALDATTATAFYTELARVMTDDGVYIEGTYYPSPEGYLGEEMERITRTSKAMLSDMIVDTVSGKLSLRDHLNYDDQEELIEELGLERNHFIDVAGDGVTHSLITVISKAG